MADQEEQVDVIFVDRSQSASRNAYKKQEQKLAATEANSAHYLSRMSGSLFALCIMKDMRR